MLSTLYHSISRKEIDPPPLVCTDSLSPLFQGWAASTRQPRETLLCLISLRDPSTHITLTARRTRRLSKTSQTRTSQRRTTSPSLYIASNSPGPRGRTPRSPNYPCNLLQGVTKRSAYTYVDQTGSTSPTVSNSQTITACQDTRSIILIIGLNIMSFVQRTLICHWVLQIRDVLYLLVVRRLIQRVRVGLVPFTLMFCGVMVSVIVGQPFASYHGFLLIFFFKLLHTLLYMALLHHTLWGTPRILDSIPTRISLLLSPLCLMVYSGVSALARRHSRNMQV